MNARGFQLTFAIGVLAFIASCAPTTNQSTDTQQSPQVKPVSSKENVATEATTIKVDGSSTVYPITEAITKKFQSEQNNNAQVQVQISGTSGGFEKFCAGKTDISNASRPILKAELEQCRKNNVSFFELPIAFDALTVVVNPKNTWAKDITINELKKIWEPSAQGKITNWNQVRASWPNRPLKLFGPGEKSGTFDYFTEATVGKARASRKDYTASEDDEVLASGISKDPNALGYFGYAYLEEHQDKLRALPVDSGKGPIMPSPETVEKAQYQPLSRPLFIYVSAKSLQKEPVRDFVAYYIDNAPKTVSSVGYVPLPAEAYHIDKVHFYSGKVGTVFEGKAETNLTIGQVLRRRKQF